MQLQGKNARSPKPLSPALRRALRDVADDVVVWRKLRGLTQAQLADRAGVSRDTLVRVLRGLGVLDSVHRALDPYETDVGRMRSDEQLPRRVRPRRLTGRDDV
jgi:DNA-binding transcriptional regulator LsrR (DeoR family)